MVRPTLADSLKVAPAASNLLATDGSMVVTSLEKPSPVVSAADPASPALGAWPPAVGVTGTENTAALGVPGADVIQYVPGIGSVVTPNTPVLLDWPSVMLSICTVSWAGPASTWLTVATRPRLTDAGSNAGIGPAKMPVVGSMAGTVRLVSCPARPLALIDTVASACWFEASGVGVTALVERWLSRLDGPDLTEFTSNATTE